MGSIPGWGTKILHTIQCDQKKKNSVIKRLQGTAACLSLLECLVNVKRGPGCCPGGPPSLLGIFLSFFFFLLGREGGKELGERRRRGKKNSVSGGGPLGACEARLSFTPRWLNSFARLLLPPGDIS